METNFAKKLIALLLLAFVIALSVSLMACGTISSSANSVDVNSGSIADSSLNDEQYSSSEECSHQIVIDQAVAPTCESAGLTEGSRCDLCGEVLVEQEIVDALGHSYVNGKCDVCGVTEGEGGNIEIVDGYIYFGEYPQTIKEDSVSITSTTNEKG